MATGNGVRGQRVRFFLDGRLLHARAAERPTFRSGVGGRSWDHLVSNINGRVVCFHYDSTWGTYYYFDWARQWYKVHIEELLAIAEGEGRRINIIALENPGMPE